MTTIGPPSEITVITYFNIHIVKENNRAGVKAHWLRALTAFLDDPGLVPSTIMSVYNHLYLQSQGT